MTKTFNSAVRIKSIRCATITMLPEESGRTYYWNMEINRVRSSIQVDFSSTAGTVYYGTLNITTGLLTVTHGYHLFDGTETFSAIGSGIKTYFAWKIGKNSVVSWVRSSHFTRNGAITSSSASDGMADRTYGV